MTGHNWKVSISQDILTETTSPKAFVIGQELDKNSYIWLMEGNKFLDVRDKAYNPLSYLTKHYHTICSTHYTKSDLDKLCS